MDISIIILHYKNTAKTAKCLDSIKNSDLGALAYETIVVDNGSGDDIAAILKDRYPEAILISSEKNLGMGGGNNLGIRKARGEFLCVLNDDIVLKKDSLMILYRQTRADDKIGLAAPKLINSDGTFQPSGFRFPSLATPVLRRTFLGRYFKKYLDGYVAGEADSGALRECDWIMGSCLFIRKSVLDKVGGFDERFFMYFEDTDLCRRIWHAGFKVLYYPEAAVIHEHSRYSAQKPWYIAPFTDRLAREHIKSFIKYTWKWRNTRNS
ncbi:MAG: glycosyltransferase family 2 protein [Candidatus Falkowbacteria bacterium]